MPERPRAGNLLQLSIASLARLRVALGFVFGVLVLVLAQPTVRSVLIGMSVAVGGEAIRVWAAGHLRKSQEVTVSGPYRWMPHPVAVLIAIYLGATLTAAIKSEEAFLRRAFGDQYDLYRSGIAAQRRERQPGARRRFSLAQAIANREYRAVAGLGATILLLIWKATYNDLLYLAH